MTLHLDDGDRHSEITPNPPDIGVVVRPMVGTGQFNYGADPVLLVVASPRYRAGVSIRAYSQFLAARAERKTA